MKKLLKLIKCLSKRSGENIKKNRKREGFTLVEVMVTVTIIGILSSMAMMSYTNVQKKAKENIDYATAANIATAAQMAITEGKSDISIGSLVSDGYLQSTPKPQKNGSDSFTITVSNESVTVKLGKVTMYPREEVKTP